MDLIYGARHIELVSAYKRTFKVLSKNHLYHIPSSAKAIDAHNQALLDLRLFLDSIGIEMPKGEDSA